MLDRLEKGSASVIQCFHQDLNDPVLLFVGQVQGNGSEALAQRLRIFASYGDMQLQEPL